MLKALVRPVRISIPNEDDGVTTLRGVGFRFNCSCGVFGPRRKTYGDARKDLRMHRLDHAIRAEREDVSPAREREGC